MTKTVDQITEEVDEALCAIFDALPTDYFTLQLILDYCHEHKEEIARFIKYR